MGPINFGIMANLRFIIFSFILGTPITGSNTSMAWIIECLRYMSDHGNRLEELSLMLFPNPTTPVTFSLEEWTASLDSILTGMGFQRLKVLSISLHSPYPDFVFPSTIDVLVVEHLPLLKEAGRLSVQSFREDGRISLLEDAVARITRGRRAR
jgi:hypothetical protein